MNDRCAAGTGRFLEIMAQALEVPLAQMGRESLRARRAGGGGIRISNTCTVFAESEVVSLLTQRKPRREIILALHEAVADRIAGMAVRFPLGREVTLSGGVAKNRGVADCIGRRLGVRINIPSEPQIVGALGAALLAGG
jgi:predicted CoA-substrate-specific enzyme activase